MTRGGLGRCGVWILLWVLGLPGCASNGDEMTQENQLPEFDKLWRYDAPGETRKAFEALLPQAEASGDGDYCAQLLTQIARTHGLEGNFDQAHEVLDRAEARLGEGASVGRARYLLERGRAVNSSGKSEESRHYFLEARQVAEDCEADFHAVDALHMLGIVATPTDSVTWNVKAMERAEASQDPRARGWLGALYNNLGWTFHDMEQFDKALELFEKGLEWRLEKGQDHPVRIARWSVARTLRSLGRVEEALAIQEQLLSEYRAAGEMAGYVLEEMAECLLALERQDEARGYFAGAFLELSKDPWLQKNQAERLERLQKLGAEVAGD